MLSIGQLAAYAGVTARAVRHYHQIGLLPEPDRDVSGYRTYGAAAVVALIRIRTLAEAGVPLARVQELLDADPEAFREATTRIDADLRRQIRDLQTHRRRIARLASDDSLAVPREVGVYLDRLRELGSPEALVQGERDAWIVVAARYPDRIADFMHDKLRQLEDPRTRRFYELLGQGAVVDGPLDESGVQEMADLLTTLFEEAAASGELEAQAQAIDDSGFVQLLDSMAQEHAMLNRLREVLAKRGWVGWTRVARG